MMGSVLEWLMAAGMLVFGAMAWEEYGEHGPGERWRALFASTVICGAGMVITALVVAL